VNLVITAIGAVTPVGLDAVTTCASVRAGLSRPTAVLHFPSLDPDTQRSVPIAGHAVSGVTEGFSGVGRWLQVAALAVEDLCRSGALPADLGFWRRTGVAVVTPVLDDTRFQESPDCQPESVGTTYLAPLFESLRLPIAEGASWLVDEGHSGAVSAIAAAQVGHTFDRVLVIAADSYLDAFSLLWLAELGRLKDADNPVGLFPGEAAVALLVESRSAAEARRAPILATVAGLSVAEAGGGSRGRALGAALEAALAEAQIAGPVNGDLIVDLNGEEWRARALAEAMTRSPRRVDGCRLVLPAQSVGDTGAASAALAIACGARALHRGYASGDRCVILSCAEDGAAGALVLGR
jgi:3-oxoacyl-[acyl-carrier-protein] synthase-1